MKMQRFIRDPSGTVLAFFGMALAMLLASAAIAVDMGYAYVIKTRLQGTADFAAMVGAAELTDETDVKTNAQAYAVLNMPSESNGEVLSQDDVTLGNWDASNRVFTPDAEPLNAVRVVTRRSDDNGNPLNLFFARVLGIEDVNISRMAIATRTTSTCVIALGDDPGSDNFAGIMLNSNGSITTEDCGIHSNSPDDNGIETNSGGEITIDGDADICSAGNYEGSGYSPDPTTGCVVKPDPLAGLAPPTFGSCDHTDKVVVDGGVTVTLSPGRYCKGLEISDDSTGIFEPGIYIIEGDKFIVNSNSTAEGTEVSIYIRDKDAQILWNQNSHIDLSAPTSGAMAGVLLYVDRDISDITQHEINSDSTSQLNGIIYMPGSELLINSAGQMGGSGSCTNFVVRNVTVNSNSSLYVGQDYDNCGLPLPEVLAERVRLVR